MTALPTNSGPGQLPGPLAKVLGNPGTTINKLDSFLGTPGGGFLMNLLAQSGRSLTPGPSPLGAVGRAGLATQQQQRQAGMDDLQRQLIESRIGLNTAKADPANVNAAANNVQTTFKGANGNMHIVTRAGDVKDTGSAFNENVKFFEQADGSVVGVDASTGDRLGTVISPDEAAAANRRKAQTDAAQTLPTDIAGLDSTLNKVDATIQKIEDIKPLASEAGVGVAVRGELPGFLGGDARKLKQEVKSLQANLGFDELQKMRAASKTGGALGQVSERELDLLISAVRSLDVEGDPDLLTENFNKVITHYNNYKREIEIMKNLMREQAGQAPVQQDRPISEMTDAELEAIVNGNP